MLEVKEGRTAGFNPLSFSRSCERVEEGERRMEPCVRPFGTWTLRGAALFHLWRGFFFCFFHLFCLLLLFFVPGAKRVGVAICCACRRCRSLKEKIFDRQESKLSWFDWMIISSSLSVFVFILNPLNFKILIFFVIVMCLYYKFHNIHNFE